MRNSWYTILAGVLSWVWSWVVGYFWPPSPPPEIVVHPSTTAADAVGRQVNEEEERKEQQAQSERDAEKAEAEREHALKVLSTLEKQYAETDDLAHNGEDLNRYLINLGKTLIPVLVFSSALSFGGAERAYAQGAPAPSVSTTYYPPLLPIPPGSDIIKPLAKGEPAPFTGQLFSPETAIRWGHYLEQAKMFREADRELQTRQCYADVAYMTRKLELEKEGRVLVEKDLRDRLTTSDQQAAKLQQQLLTPPSFWSSPALWFAAGVVSTTLVVLAVGAVK